jgi:hypothetical protein
LPKPRSVSPERHVFLFGLDPASMKLGHLS